MQINNIISQLPRNGSQGTHPVSGITKLVIHHDAEWRPDEYDDLTRYVGQARFHINRGEDGLQYNYKISNLGDVYLCRDWTDILWHCGNYAVNCSSIAICLDGNMETQYPTEAQLQGLQDLLDELCFNHPEFPASQGDVYYHNEVALPGYGTACCGANLKQLIVKYRNTGKMLDAVTIPTPTTPQTPPTSRYYRVFDYLGTQVGAYSVLANAQSKLDSMEAGCIKDPDMNVVVQKDKVPTSIPGPFVGPDAPPEVVPPVLVPDPVPNTQPEPPKETLLDAIIKFIKQIIERIVTWKK